MNKLFILLLTFAILSCNNNISLKSKDENKTKLAFPEILALLTPNDAVAYFYTRDIDKSLTTNCGVATPGTTTGTTGATGTTGTTTTTTGGATGTATSKRIVLSQLVFKTGETLTMKFQYDSTQYQGSLDQQQGFTLTGGIFGATVKGTQGTVKWTGQSLGYIDETNNAAQSLTFLIVTVSLRGTYTPGSSSSGTTPVECNTTDGINCTSSISTTKCFTQDYVKCVANNTGGTPITISGSINCNAANVIPQ